MVLDGRIVNYNHYQQAIQNSFTKHLIHLFCYISVLLASKMLRTFFMLVVIYELVMYKTCSPVMYQLRVHTTGVIDYVIVSF